MVKGKGFMRTFWLQTLDYGPTSGENAPPNKSMRVAPSLVSPSAFPVATRAAVHPTDAAVQESSHVPAHASLGVHRDDAEHAVHVADRASDMNATDVIGRSNPPEYIESPKLTHDSDICMGASASAGSRDIVSTWSRAATVLRLPWTPAFLPVDAKQLAQRYINAVTDEVQKPISEQVTARATTATMLQTSAQRDSAFYSNLSLRRPVRDGAVSRLAERHEHIKSSSISISPVLHDRSGAPRRVPVVFLQQKGTPQGVETRATVPQFPGESIESPAFRSMLSPTTHVAFQGSHPTAAIKGDNPASTSSTTLASVLLETIAAHSRLVEGSVDTDDASSTGSRHSSSFQSVTAHRHGVPMSGEKPLRWHDTDAPIPIAVNGHTYDYASPSVRSAATSPSM
jgi:hypothetical protein